MNIMLPVPSIFKPILKLFQEEEPPCERARSIIRTYKPGSCPLCAGILHGNGWRCRSVLESWKDWGVLWYWRIECQECGAVHCLMPDIVIPDLLYAVEVVAEVVVGRLCGKKAKAFAPHRRTQKRWMDRLFSWWPVAQSIGAIKGALTEWTCSVSRFQEAIRRCAFHHVGLFFPSHSERAKTCVSPRRKYPAIGTHQRCLSTEVLLL